MKISSYTSGNTLFVQMNGELDEHASASARGQLDELVENCCVKNFVFDLSEMTFMDSTGIGVMIGRFKKLKAKSVSSFIKSPSLAVNKILLMAGLYEIMPKI